MESGRSRSAAHIASVEHSFCTICSAECLIRVTEPPIDRHKPTDRACPPEMGRFKDQKSMESSQETQLFCFFFGPNRLDETIHFANLPAWAGELQLRGT